MGKKNIDWCRYVMNHETHRLISNLNYSKMSAFEISGSRWQKFPFASYSSSVYPEFDLMVNPTSTELYDIVLAEQVLEHVRNPYKALDTVRKILKPGGFFLSTTPFLLKVHGSPKGKIPIDYWRWTPLGIKTLFEDCGFDTIKVDSWGNKKCVEAYLRFESLGPFDPNNCSLENEHDSPIMIWILGMKKND